MKEGFKDMIFISIILFVTTFIYYQCSSPYGERKQDLINKGFSTQEADSLLLKQYNNGNEIPYYLL